ncbi:putative GNAT family acetyltransferase [Lentithecium fluviatile CBS 122367]|uniref:Putative GNAT family acetyltransferase n=1 Tax=Lentithecium fluviatile CBS 122367 TaxID=1168545 RepID=A0A6G1J985_9PLEO|nr:putative GNAT family acetyltransferase [Lentithecium fluviatile CBS 122367]
MAAAISQQQAAAVVEPIGCPGDFPQIIHCISEAFGRQARDAVWMVMNPAWDTPQGQKDGAAQLLRRWQSTNLNKGGQPNTVFLKATLPDPKHQTKPKTVGMAIWQQASFADGYGDPPSTDPGDGLNALDPTEARFASQMFRSLWRRRVEVAKEKANNTPPAIFVLDMCCVHPDFQRRGIAAKLVQWGLDEAKRRGNLECTTEASSMGRGAYVKLGFQPEGDGADIIYEVDDEFLSRDKPPNVFLRTGS